VFTSSSTFLSYRRFFSSCFTNKGQPDSPLVLRCMLTPGRFKSVTVLRKRFGVIITYRKSNKNSPMLLQMLKMLPSCMNALSTTYRSHFTHWSSSPKTDEISWRMFLSSSACILAIVSCSFKVELPLSFLRQEL